MAGPEQCPRGNNPVPSLQVGQQCRVDRGHAGGGGAAGLGVLDQAQALFQHRQGRIGEAGVLIVLDCSGECGFGLFGVVVHIA